MSPCICIQHVSQDPFQSDVQCLDVAGALTQRQALQEMFMVADPNKLSLLVVDQTDHEKGSGLGAWSLCRLAVPPSASVGTAGSAAWRLLSLAHGRSTITTYGCLGMRLQGFELAGGVAGNSAQGGAGRSGGASGVRTMRDAGTRMMGGTRGMAPGPMGAPLGGRGMLGGACHSKFALREGWFLGFGGAVRWPNCWILEATPGALPLPASLAQRTLPCEQPHLHQIPPALNLFLLGSLAQQTLCMVDALVLQQAYA